MAHQEDLGEGLEGPDSRDQDQEESRGREQRQSDKAELIPLCCAVNTGGFIEFAGDVAQPGQEDDGAVTGIDPDVVENNHHQRQPWADQNGARLSPNSSLKIPFGSTSQVCGGILSAASSVLAGELLRGEKSRLKWSMWRRRA